VSIFGLIVTVIANALIVIEISQLVAQLPDNFDIKM